MIGNVLVLLLGLGLINAVVIGRLKLFDEASWKVIVWICSLGSLAWLIFWLIRFVINPS